VSARDAFEPGAPQLYGDCPNNEAYFYQAGDKAKTDAAFAAAAHVVEQRLVINRVTANPIEPRAYLCDCDGERYTLYATRQQPHVTGGSRQACPREHLSSTLAANTLTDDNRAFRNGFRMGNGAV